MLAATFTRSPQKIVQQTENLKNEEKLRKTIVLGAQLLAHSYFILLARSEYLKQA